MHMTTVFLFVILITKTSGTSIPFIQNVFLQSSTNSTIIRQNSSCQECLCENFISNNTIKYVALNCFSNETCQFFQSFPLSYKLQPSASTQLYFLQNQYPNASTCCMPNITEVLIRLQTVVPITMNLTFQPSGLGYDENAPTEAAVIGWNPGVLYWFNPLTTTFIRNASSDGILTIALYNNQTFTAVNGVPTVDIRDTQTNNYLGNFTYPSLAAIRKIIFINNGQAAVIPTQSNESVTIFNVNSRTNYTFQQEIPVPVQNAHGIAKVNDTFFYVSSWGDRRIASCKYENLTWTTNIFVNGTATGDGSHIAVDECDRVWFVNTQFGLRIYDSSGVEIANWNMTIDSSNTIYDILLLPNYVLMVTYNEEQKIIHYDPQLTCP